MADLLIVLAVVLSAIGNIVNGFGYVMQKLGHNRNLAKPKEERTGCLKNKLWLMGFGTYAIGSLMHAGGLAFGPASLLTPLESLTLVTNALIAPLFLPETLRRRDIYATIIIVIGSVGCVIFGPHNSETYTIDELLDRFTGTDFLVYSTVIILVFGTDYVLVKLVEKHIRTEGIEMDGTLNSPQAKFLALSYTLIAGVFSSYTLLFTKATAEIMQTTLSGDNQFTSGWTYAMLILFIGFNVSLEHWKQKALSRFDALYVVPVFQVTLVVLSIVSSAIYFSDFAELKDDTVSLSMFIVSILLVCFGIWYLSQTEALMGPPDSESQVELDELGGEKIASGGSLLSAGDGDGDGDEDEAEGVKALDLETGRPNGVTITRTTDGGSLQEVHSEAVQQCMEAAQRARRAADEAELAAVEAIELERKASGQLGVLGKASNADLAAEDQPAEALDGAENSDNGDQQEQDDVSASLRRTNSRFGEQRRREREMRKQALQRQRSGSAGNQGVEGIPGRPLPINIAEPGSLERVNSNSSRGIAPSTPSRKHSGRKYSGRKQSGGPGPSPSNKRYQLKRIDSSSRLRGNVSLMGSLYRKFTRSRSARTESDKSGEAQEAQPAGLPDTSTIMEV